MKQFKRTTTSTEYWEKVNYVKRLLAHNYTDEEIYNDLYDYDPRLIKEWIQNAKLQLFEGISLI